ncbi:MAG: hypothetical protein QOF37_1623 [Thermoleophilaceae bacterium]|nr:hypothetical protein [Thermoleophilaceae bacterium]
MGAKTTVVLGVAACALCSAGPTSADSLPGVPQFLASCTLSHRLPDDPIVHFGMPGMSHMHDFFGNVSANAFSTRRSLVRARTTCHPTTDRSAYWTPTLYVHGRPVGTSSVTIYFEAPPARVDELRTYPPGLKMIAGHAMARRPPRDGHALWNCKGVAGRGSTRIPVCPSWSRVRLVVRFPDCWDGRRLDSPDHRRHMAYSAGGACPARAPVLVPRARFDIEYRTHGAPGALIASGPGYTAHGDFFNAWRPGVLAARIDRCIRGRMRCDYDGHPY